MTRRSLLKAAGAAAAAPAVLAQGLSTQRRPNILFLMTDQHRADCLGASGNPVVYTPNLDRIGNEGVRFRNAYSSTPTCTPARTALLTGLSPWHHGMLGMTDMAEQYSLEKPRALRAAGYYTITIGKQHFYPMRNGHGYQRMILDEHCPCGNGPQAFAAAERAVRLSAPTTRRGSGRRPRRSIRMPRACGGTIIRRSRLPCPSVCTPRLGQAIRR